MEIFFEQREGLLAVRASSMAADDAFAYGRPEYRQLVATPPFDIEDIDIDRMALGIDQPVSNFVGQNLIGAGEGGDKFRRHPAEADLSAREQRLQRRDGTQVWRTQQGHPAYFAGAVVHDHQVIVVEHVVSAIAHKRCQTIS